MSLLKELQKVLDLKDPWEEAKKKLRATTMIVNGELHYVTEFENPHVYTIHPLSGDKKCIFVNTLQAWLPETGLYILDNGEPIYIRKLPKRQWTRSFSTNFYKVKKLDGAQIGVETIIMYLKNLKKHDFYVTKEQNIYFHDILIGYIKNSSTIVCTNSLYKQELLDWSKNVLC